MTLRDCLNSAVEQKAISSRQADELHRYYEARFKKARATMSDGQAAAAAKQEVAAMLRADGAQKKRQVLLMEGKRKELTETILNYRTLTGKADVKKAVMAKMIHYGEGTGAGVSMDQLKHGIISLVHRDLSEVMDRFKQSRLLGLRENKADIPDLVKELSGEASGSAAAKRLAGALRNVMEDMRLRFNKAGGNIPKRKDFDLPHVHDARRIMKLGKTPDEARAKWKAIITPLLDPESMARPDTGEIVGREGLDESLDYVFDSIVSDGWAHRKPEMRKFGKGSLANRYQEGRFLQFRSADDWMNYNSQFGEPDVIGLIFDHVNKMASDIAAMETFGPNPDAMIEWAKQAAQHELGKARVGKSDLIGKVSGKDAGRRAAYRIDALWRSMRGRETVWDAPATIAGDIRNVATAAMLGFTSVTAMLTDPTISALARKLAGIPLSIEIHNMVKAMALDSDALEATKRAIIADDYLHVLRTEIRLADNMTGHNWSRYLADRALTLNLLKAATSARKRVEATSWHGELGRLARKNADWIDLDPGMRRMMEGFGLTDKDWHAMRAGVDEQGFLSPASVLDKTGDRRLAETYAGLIHQMGERSVPQGDPRIKSGLLGRVERGTALGELAYFSTQFLSFGMSFTARQSEAIYLYSMRSNTKAGRFLRGAGYVGPGMVLLTMGAALSIQLRTIADGKDPEDMEKPQFWIKAFIAGGGGGLFADFFAKSENRFGGGILETLGGPGGAILQDVGDLTLGSIPRAARGDDLELGKRVNDILARYVPVLPSHPLTRLAYRRLIIDQLQWMTDPKADKSFKAKQRAAKYYWGPGQLTPKRGPDLRHALP